MALAAECSKYYVTPHKENNLQIQILFTEIVRRFASGTGLNWLWREEVAEIRCLFFMKSCRCWPFAETRVKERISAIAANEVVSTSRIVIVVIAGGVSGARISVATTGRIAVVISGGRSWPVLSVTGCIVRREGSKRRQQRAKASCSACIVMESRRRRAGGSSADRYGVVGRSAAVVGMMMDVVLLLLELARGFTLPPLGPSVLEPNLNAGLAQLQAQSQFFPGENIRIRCSFKGSLQLFQLIWSECCPRNNKIGLLFNNTTRNIFCQMTNLVFFFFVAELLADSLAPFLLFFPSFFLPLVVDVTDIPVVFKLTC